MNFSTRIAVLALAVALLVAGCATSPQPLLADGLAQPFTMADVRSAFDEVTGEAPLEGDLRRVLPVPVAGVDLNVIADGLPGGAMILVFATLREAEQGLLAVRDCCTDSGSAGGRWATRVGNVVAVLHTTSPNDFAVRSALGGLVDGMLAHDLQQRLEDLGYDVEDADDNPELASARLPTEPVDIVTFTVSGADMPYATALPFVVYASPAAAQRGEAEIAACCADEGAGSGLGVTRVDNIVALLGGSTEGDSMLGIVLQRVGETEQPRPAPTAAAVLVE